MSQERKKTLLLIDSFALIFRAYYAFPPTLTTVKGEPINAVYGFTSLLLDVLNKFKPSHVIAVFDPGGPTIRQSEYVLYKSNREEAEEDFVVQIPKVQELLEAFDIPVLKVAGYEADDVIGTIDKKYSGKWAQTIIVTGDQDAFQLVDEDTFVYLAARRFAESKLFNGEDVYKKLGIKPEQVIDYKALCGDPSDNIPGVKGVGTKTAVKLLEEYANLENIYNNIENIKGSLQSKLQENYEMAIKSQKLATIDNDVPISFDFENAKFDQFNLNKVLSLFNELSFKSLTKKAQNLADEMGVRDNIGLFAELDSESSANTVKIENFSQKEDLKKIKEIYILASYNNLDKNPLYWEIKELFFSIDEQKVFNVHIRDIQEFFNLIIKNKIEIVSFDFKKLLHSLKNLKIKNLEKIKYYDIGFASIVLGQGQVNYSLDSVLSFFGEKYFDFFPNNLESLMNSYKKSIQYFQDKKYLEVFNLELSILDVVVEMERNGIILDPLILKDFEDKLLDLQKKLKAAIFADVGHEFNINSPKQVGEVLFAEKNLPGGRKTKSGQFSTDERSLKKLKAVDPLVENILKYREVDKLLSTYIKALPIYIDMDGKVHATFDQLGAVSGRFSSKNPNLQNIPVNESLDINTRDAFIASKNSTFISFDYSQQELRILAAFSKEEKMIESFNNNEDIHKLTAAEIFGIPLEKVEDMERNIGKTINFSVIYGISAFGLSERLEIDRNLASEFISKYYLKYPKVKEYFEKVNKNARAQGYSETVLGRRRSNAAINSDNRIYRAAAERELTNFVIQGSAADIMKLAMKNIENILPKYPARLLLQIHDEFLFEYDEDSKANMQDFINEIKHCMLNLLDIGVNYKVEAKIGKSWGSMKKLK